MAKHMTYTFNTWVFLTLFSNIMFSIIWNTFVTKVHEELLLSPCHPHRMFLIKAFYICISLTNGWIFIVALHLNIDPKL